jgi:hypothetical protein
MSEIDFLKRPPAGLSLFEQILVGSSGATEELLKIAPEVLKRPPAGLSLLERAQFGSESAKDDILNILKPKN